MPELQSSLSCLEKLIGLAGSDCPCNTTGRPADYDESLSGLYMDDYEHGLAGVFALSAKDCGDGSIWDVLKKARYEGTMDFMTYLFKAIGQNLNTYVDGFSGEFGEINRRTTNTADKSCTKARPGFYVRPNIYKGAQIKFKKVWLAIDVAGTYEVDLHDVADPSTAVTSVSIGHPGRNKHVGIDIPADKRIQPLAEAGKPITYSFSYERGTGFPLNYTYSCGGCGNDKAPTWMRNKYMESNGFCVDSLDEVLPGSACCNRSYTGGLIVEWELICDPAEWICNQDESFWKSTQWGRIAAKGAQITQTQKLIAAILDTSRVNFYTMFSAEELQEKRLKLSKLTDELVSYLSTHMPDHVSHCWSCTPTSGFSKRSIIV